MTDTEILRYLLLLNRRSEVILNSGINWKPEYEKELFDIENELKELGVLVDLERDRRKREAVY